jgi:hypothetical protein
MKTILTETVLVTEAILFWAVALPAAAVAFPALLVWEKAAAAIAQRPVGPAGGPGMSPVTA